MVAFNVLMEEEAQQSPKITRSISSRIQNLSNEFHLLDSFDSFNVNNIVLVMDALTVFDPVPLIWSLRNLVHGRTIITLLGVMPFLNIPLSVKAWGDIWILHKGEYLSMENDSPEAPEQGTSLKYLKFHAIGDLCRRYGVSAQMKVRIGYPKKLLIVEETTRIHATWVVLHKHFKKESKYFAQKIPCNIVLVNERSEGEMIRSRSLIDDSLSTPGKSPASWIPTPSVIINDNLVRELQEKALAKQEKESLDGYLYYI